MEGETQATESAPTAESAPVAQENTTENTQTNETQSSSDDGKPAGWNQVTFTPEQQARVDRIYGNMKRFENENRESKQALELVTQRMMELQHGQSQIVQHLQQEDFTNAEDQIRTQKLEALNKGDVEAYDRLNDKLIDIKVAKKTAAKQPVQQQQPQQQQQRALSGDEAINSALQNGSINTDEATAYRAWSGETDTSGNLKRPWVNQGDIRNSAAAIEGRAVFSNPLYANKPFAEKLKIIDQRMGLVPQNQSQQNVLGAGNLTGNKKSSTVKLSPYQEKIAVKTRFGGPKAKSDADHLEAYRQAVVKSQSKGAR